MDPVNKWLTVVVLFMVVLIFALFRLDGGSGYRMQVVPYSDTHDMVYVLDTASGEIKAKLHPHDKHLVGKGDNIRTNETWQTVRKEEERNYYGNSNYNKNYTPTNAQRRQW